MIKSAYPALLSIPHGGDVIPPEVRKLAAIGYKDIIDDGDAFTRDIFNLGDKVSAVVTTEIARAIVDLNRAPTDLPPENPDGVIKSITATGVPVYKNKSIPDSDVINKLMEKYYYPYHQKIESIIDEDDIKVAFDCHSMASIGPYVAKDAGEPRPLICLSNKGDLEGLPENNGQTVSSKEIIDLALEGFRLAFENEDVDVEVSSTIKLNDPFKGGYIVSSYSRKNLSWIQVEINRALYLGGKWFDYRTLKMQSDRLDYIRQKFFKSIQHIFK